MSLIYFHRFLIFCAILFSIFFAWHAFGAFQEEGSVGQLVVAVVSTGAAVGLSFYLRTVRMPRRPDQVRDSHS